MLARALARVVAHEIVHSVAPEAPHSQSGLMQQKLTKAHLTAPHLRLSPPSTEDLRSGLPPRAVVLGRDEVDEPPYIFSRFAGRFFRPFVVSFT